MYFLLMSCGAFFWARSARPKKPGFPLQVLGFANANPVGFPLQSLARRQLRISPRNCLWQLHAYNQAAAILSGSSETGHEITEGNFVGT
jgi:hypothetical protein